MKCESEHKKGLTMGFKMGIKCGESFPRRSFYVLNMFIKRDPDKGESGEK